MAGLLGMVGNTIRSIGQGARGLLDQQQQPNGLLGQPTPFNPTMNTQPSIMGLPQQDQPPVQSNKAAYAFSQMADIIGNWGKTPEEQAKVSLYRAQADAERAKMSQQEVPFGGDSFDNQLVRQRAREYMKVGVPYDEALSRAANDVLQTKQQYVADPVNPGQLMPVGRKALPDIGAGAQPGPVMQAPQVQSEELPPPAASGALPASSFDGGLLPPPAGMPSPSFNPASKNPYAGSGAVQLEAAKTVANEAAKRDVQRMADRQEQAPQEEASIIKANDNIANTIRAIDEAMAITGGTTAGFGSLLQSIPETQARTLKGKLDQIGASTAFDTLSEMRKNSPTGGALGSIAVPELELLKASQGSLDQGLGPEALRENLKKVRDNYVRFQGRLNEAFQRKYGYAPQISKTPEENNDPFGLRR